MRWWVKPSVAGSVIAGLGIASFALQPMAQPAIVANPVPALSGLQVSAPPGSLSHALDILQMPGSATYTLTDPRQLSLVLNHRQIGSSDKPEAIAMPIENSRQGAFVIGQEFRHYVGGPTAMGGRETSVIETVLQAPTSPSNLNRNYVPLATQFIAASDDGGTEAAPRGAVFGVSLNVMALGVARNLLNVTGGEVNVAMHPGSSAHYKSLWQLVGRSDDKVQGGSVDAMLALGNQVGAVSWKNGILITRANGEFPIDPSGTILRAEAGRLLNGIDFSAVTFTGASIKVPGFTVDGAGRLFAPNLPTSDPHVAGQIWDNNGVLTRSRG